MSRMMSYAKIASDLSSVVVLNDGVQMPLFGLGMFRAEKGANAEEAVIYALRNGYHLIDTAQIYQNEEDVGRGIKRSGVRREDVFVVSKVWNDLHGFDSTVKSVHKSLARLGLDYVDMFLIHSPYGGKNIETYDALLDLKKKGLIRSVGVSNYGIQHLEGLRQAGRPLPSVNQIEMHPFQRKEELVRYCIANGVYVMGYSPLAQGKKNDDPDLIRMAETYKKSVAQVMIRWSVQNGYVTIPKSTKPHRIDENAAVFDFVLNENDMKVLNSKPDFVCGWDPTTSPWDEEKVPDPKY